MNILIQLNLGNIHHISYFCSEISKPYRHESPNIAVKGATQPKEIPPPAHHPQNPPPKFVVVSLALGN